MFSGKNRSNYGKNTYLLKRIRAITAGAIIIMTVVISFVILTRARSSSRNEKRELIQEWNAQNYDRAYEISKNALFQKPVDYFFLTMNGFASYQLGISQINNQNMLTFIDECIFSLRKAILNNAAKNDARLFYVLGKAYGYKGTEYSDLAIKYITMASDMSYNASDIPEYLGLAYAASGDYRKSVEAFSLAFSKNERISDNLLLSIARSYMAM